MRKYFLATAIALLATSTANATTDYAEVTAKATIEVAGTFTCDNMDWGTIVVKQNNKEALIDYGSTTESEDVIYAGDFTYTACYGENLNQDNLQYTNSVDLKNKNGKIINLHGIYHETVSDSDYNAELYGKLTIPANIESGEYIGSFTITATY